MTDSIMQTEKRCFITGYEGELDIHHCFHGIRRKAAEKWGCWCWLRHDIHMRLHDSGKALDKALEMECQRRFEALYGHQKFMDVFGKSYL